MQIISAPSADMLTRASAPDLPMAGLLAPAPDVPADAERFAIELEFVQNLCNPHYLQVSLGTCLAQV